MAGSWSHITTKTGKFRGTRLIENLGDAYEALEECYGMVQWLATGPRQRNGQVEREAVIADAQAHYKEGLNLGGVANHRIFGEGAIE